MNTTMAKTVIIDGVLYIPINSMIATAIGNGQNVSGYSCNGVNVIGNKKSIDAVRDAFHVVSAQVDQYRAGMDEYKQKYKDLRARIQTALYGEEKGKEALEFMDKRYPYFLY